MQGRFQHFQKHKKEKKAQLDIRPAVINVISHVRFRLWLSLNCTVYASFLEKQ